MRTKVLLIDDDVLFSEIVAQALQNSGYDVKVAGTGPDAIELFEAHEFDAVVCDRVLPEMSGDEIGAEIHSRQPSIPILLVSGGSGKDFDPKVFVGFCRKPFLLKTLIDQIESTIKLAAHTV